ncbi:unnamed protein product [Clavelina lepadiformis]|uniref:Uncharacterized protein n=1 Tax=Clavelina lepadiformis TaxID=159417 RepID=A0ABP0FUF7_CLALP
MKGRDESSQRWRSPTSTVKERHSYGNTHGTPLTLEWSKTEVHHFLNNQTETNNYTNYNRELVKLGYLNKLIEAQIGKAKKNTP